MLKMEWMKTKFVHASESKDSEQSFTFGIDE